MSELERRLRESKHFQSTGSEVDFGRSLDLSDSDTIPALTGTLMKMVRDAWKSPRCFVRCNKQGRWFVLCPANTETGWLGPFEGDSEIEALIVALESAP